MSGGSFSYVCYKLNDLETTINHMVDFQEMIDYCRKVGKSDIADELQQSYSAIESVINKAQEALDIERKRIYDLAHAVEWWVSGDYSESQVTEVFKEMGKQE